jgi:hypothetical protein
VIVGSDNALVNPKTSTGLKTTTTRVSPFRARFQSDADYNTALFVGGIAVAAALLLIGFVWSRQHDVTEAFGKLFAKKKRRGL